MLVPAPGRALLLLAVLCAGCYPVNPPLVRQQDGYGYRWQTVIGEQPDPMRDETFVIVTLSGGGTRAAAFSYGVLRELGATPVGEHDLLADVDVISSVSGGSFAAAYYGVFGRERFFRDFPRAVLHRSLELGIFAHLLLPWNFLRLFSPHFSRSDVADAYYDASIFEHRTFEDLPLARPFIVLNATDIARGAQLSFTQEHFDRLCSDLSRVTVSRGVTASSAFPVAFPPLTLKNYGALRCGYQAPPWVWSAENGDFDAAPPRWDLARTWRSYEDASRRPYIHLSDGGLADNIGLRAVQAGVVTTGRWDLLARTNAHAVRRLVVITVDAKPRSEACIDRSGHAPNFVTVLNAAASTPMENYSSETVETFRSWFRDRWETANKDFCTRKAGCDALAKDHCRAHPRPKACEAVHRSSCYAHLNPNGAPPVPALYSIHVRFDAIPDCHERHRLQSVGTRLRLPRDQIDGLVEWGGRLLRTAPEFERLLTDLRSGGLPHVCE